MSKLLIALLLFSFGADAIAQSLDLDALAKQPGATVTKRSEGGSEIVEIRLGGVTFTRKDGQILSFDNSGHGAVLCTWEIIVGMKTGADVCFPGEFPELSSLLGEEIEALNAFIIANSLIPVTMTNLQARFDERMRRVHPGGSYCDSVRQAFIVPFNNQLRSTSHAELKRQFDQTRAVSRPPVMDPCL
ncbi:MAG: hypothetical protein PSV46_17920 [Reyranella sp.]|nr:hypothetical protein [Reyranella sp.]